jgi:uridine kinase
VAIPTYDFATHSRRSETQLLLPPKVLILEGILLFADPELAKEMDVSVFVDCSSETRFIRRLQRDIQERGRDADSVCAQVGGLLIRIDLMFWVYGWGRQSNS